MESAPNEGTADLGDKKSKIGGNVYVPAGKDDETSNFEKEKSSIASMWRLLRELEGPIYVCLCISKDTGAAEVGIKGAFSCALTKGKSLWKEWIWYQKSVNERSKHTYPLLYI